MRIEPRRAPLLLSFLRKHSRGHHLSRFFNWFELLHQHFLFHLLKPFYSVSREGEHSCSPQSVHRERHSPYATTRRSGMTALPVHRSRYFNYLRTRHWEGEHSCSPQSVHRERHSPSATTRRSGMTALPDSGAWYFFDVRSHTMGGRPSSVAGMSLIPNKGYLPLQPLMRLFEQRLRTLPRDARIGDRDTIT